MPDRNASAFLHDAATYEPAECAPAATPAAPASATPGSPPDAPVEHAPDDTDDAPLFGDVGVVFATLAEEDAFYAGVTHGIRVSTPGHPVYPALANALGLPPARAPLRETIAHGAPDAADSPDPSLPARRVRVDGWTGERKARFIEMLAACGVVADAARAAGMSVASAYALRNRRDGRAWGDAWDAVLIHRARGRMSDELVSRAMDGCTETITRGGVEWGTRHRHDNRLAMAVLTRLDRLAERPRTDEDAATLRAVSEDLDDFIDCIEADGDADAFVDARRPPPPAPSAPPAPRPRRDDYDLLASLDGCSDYRDVAPSDIDVSDLDPDLKAEWDTDAIVRAKRSFYLDWLDMAERGGTRPDAADCPAEFMRIRAEIVARMEADGVFGTDDAASESGPADDGAATPRREGGVMSEGARSPATAD